MLKSNYRETLELAKRYEKDLQYVIPLLCAMKYDLKVLAVRRAACQRVSSVGDRYTCRVNGRVTCLWMEKGIWFMDAKE